MYLDKAYRGSGVAQRMLGLAMEEARSRGFIKMILSTAQIQKAADRFYRKSGFRLIRTEVAGEMTAKQAGGRLIRLHFEKALSADSFAGFRAGRCVGAGERPAQLRAKSAKLSRIQSITMRAAGSRLRWPCSSSHTSRRRGSGVRRRRRSASNPSQR